MIHNLPTGFTKDVRTLERDVRTRITQDNMHVHEYEHLVVKPYPEPAELTFWLNTQFPDPGQYVTWKGWMLFKQESDAVLMALTWPINN